MQQRIVFLVDGCNRPLHPTRKLDMVNRWLRQGVAKIVRFFGKIMVVQVLKQLNPQKDKPTYWLGIDPGDTIGVCLVRISCNKIKTLFLAELVTRSKEIVKLIQDRASYRNIRRYFRRKRIKRRGFTPKYRPARFNNRKRSDKWLAPSVRHFLETHKMVIQRIAQYIPDVHVSVEYAKFDIHKLVNPDVEEEQYQHGKLFGYANMRDYVLYRDKYQCQLCHKKSNLQLHHVISRSKGGKNHPDNLVTLCNDCHAKVHNDTSLMKKLQNEVKRIANFSPTSRLNIIMPFLKQWLIDKFNYVWFCTGADTRVIRKELSLIKTHYNDAYCISVNKIFRNGNNVEHDLVPLAPIQFVQKRQHNRRVKALERNRLYYLIKHGQKKLKVATNRNGNDESFHNKYSAKILPMLKQGYRIRVNKGVKGFRKKFSKVSFKEGATIKVNDQTDVLKGYSLTGGFGYTYNNTMFKLRNMNVVYPFGGLKCVCI